MCVDYRVLNKFSVKNKYLVPLIQDLLDRLSKASFFAKFDEVRLLASVHSPGGSPKDNLCN